MKRRICSILLSGIMVFSLCSQPVHAEENRQSGGTTIEYCEHHTEHTAECGYVAPTEGHECGHVHDASCNYQEAGACAHEHTEACGEKGESCTHEHDEECGYTEGHVCTHEHDEECGNLEASVGSPCGFVCNICGNQEEQAGTNLSEEVLAVQELIDALPDPVGITADTFEEVSEMLEDIDAAKAELAEEEMEALDFTRYDAAISKMMELLGQSGAEEAAEMTIAGFDFQCTGKPAGTVRSINLNAALLRPDSTWTKATDQRQGDNLLYFGKYGGDPVAYRVLSSPNTQSTISDCLLLDCDKTLAGMPFYSAGNQNQWNDQCIVRNWLNGTEFYNNASVFTSLEKNAIAETQLHEQSVYPLLHDLVSDPTRKYVDYSATDKVFCLSAAEAGALYSGIDGNINESTERIKTGIIAYSCVRSTPRSGGDESGVVSRGGGINYFVNGYGSVAGVSPALNVDLSKVLFASESGFSKTYAMGSLSHVNTSTAKEWKLTLLDNNKTVRVTRGQSVSRSDDTGNTTTTLTVPYTYTDSNTGNPVSQISFMITDKPYTDRSAQVLYYEELGQTTIADGGASGTGTLTLSTELVDRCERDYFAYIIAESVNGDKETDYASKPQQVIKYTVNVTNGTLSDGRTTGDYLQGKTVTITAGAAPGGQRFKEWTVENGTISLANSTSATTSFSMPAEEVSVKANYEAIPVTAKEEETEVVAYIPSLKTTNINGIQLEGWEAINKAIPTLTKDKLLRVNGANQTLLHIDLSGSGKTIPAFVIRTADKAVGIAGLHIFIGNGDAVTFLSGNNLAGYKETNFEHKDTITEHTRTIEFLHKQPLGVTLLFHTTVPVKSAKVTVYKVVPNQSRVLVARTVSNEKGQVCFPISETATYILEY